MLAAFSNLIMLITSVTQNGFFHSFWSQAHSKVFFFYLKCLKRISQTFNNVYAEVKKSTGTQNESTDIVEKKRKVNLANITSKVLTSVNQMSFVNFNTDNRVVMWVKWSKPTQMKLPHHLMPQCKLLILCMIFTACLQQMKRFVQ